VFNLEFSVQVTFVACNLNYHLFITIMIKNTSVTARVHMCHLAYSRIKKNHVVKTRVSPRANNNIHAYIYKYIYIYNIYIYVYI